MKRGKVIGAIVLVGVIALVVAQRLGEPEAGNRAAGTQGGDVISLAQTDPADGNDAPVTGSLPAAGEVRVYAIDAAQSEVYWRIYRSGRMARLGHNHVISVTDLDGSVSLVDDLALADWSLSFSVAGLLVDDPELRARYGEEFESVPSENDKAGTKENMLTDRVLNGAMFPEISLSGTGVTGSPDAASLPVSIELLGRTIEASFPAVISIDADSLSVTGEYRLTHEDLGLEPFTALGGLMAVGQDIDFTYRIRAVAVDR
jgi:hypothetical protein